VGLSIDDFGTGYSSLAYLTSLPISELKIDGSFIRQLGSKPQSSAVVNAIIALARSLGLAVVAECVETVQQMEVLQRMGCGVMQGYLFCHPIPPAGVENWARVTLPLRATAWAAHERPR
jgi:EAL domain-containing protein (putative c-di-GMP-specific phosphodiesterase class I)